MTYSDIYIEYTESSAAVLAYTGGIQDLYSVALHLLDTSWNSVSYYLIDSVNISMPSVSIQELAEVILACFVDFVAQSLIFEMPMPGVRCPRCAEREKEQWVLPGKHCPRCNQPC